MLCEQSGVRALILIRYSPHCTKSLLLKILNVADVLREDKHVAL
jgi:hypothetical protein